MGCSQSKIENEEAVSRCKERKLYMKEAVSSRNAIAAAHSAYATNLKYAGAALSDYALGEVAYFPGSVNVTQPPLPPPSSSSSLGTESIDKLRPPPPPELSNMSQPLQRAATMPEIKIQKPEGPGPVDAPILEEEEEEEEEEGNESNDEDQHSRLRRRSSRNRNARVLEDAGASPPVTRIPQEEVPMPSQHHNTPYDYFFSVEPIPTTTLSESLPAEEVGVRNEETERKVVDEKPKKTDDKRTSDTGGGGGEGKGFESVPVEKAVKKGKQGGSVAEVKRVTKGKVSLQDLFLLLDDHFLKASESAHEVSKMLEATRLHYHSNFADNRGHIDHSSRVMRVITWNRSFKGLNDHEEVKDDFDSEEHETHATVLDKLLAWEKKLYDEVKAGELMKFEYQKKVASLNRLKKRGTNSEALEKAKAAVSHLHTRYIVDMQSMDSTVFEINRLRDEQLYPKLVQLVIGMATMWQTMRDHHERQYEVVIDLAAVSVAQSPRDTSEHHHERTEQLLMVVQDWHLQFQKLVNKQKEYIKALNNWLKLNIIPIESSLREKVSSPPRIQKPPIQELLLTWHNELEKLPDDDAKRAMACFGAAIKAIYDQQEDELKQKQRCEETRKELARKTRQFDDWYQKYTQRRVPGELDPEGSDPNAQKELGERQFVVDQLKKKLEGEEEAYQRLCLHVREKSLGSLKDHLPLLFRKMADFAAECSQMYRKLTSKSKLQRSNQSSS